ncbi:hypothetical protein P4U03_00955 [Bacillus mycoides]|uniref:hypothetical protein n=1 Tax=Bacillus cereus group TaxID=86661 RepID=UPI00159302D8|nr:MULTISPECIES: hypothetical protein [Bacillus cereus group]MCQ6567078.1 hypothetical protein [Bacillus mycoides]MED1265273.1 hypothetical protein [Bacillus mycoides]
MVKKKSKAVKEEDHEGNKITASEEGHKEMENKQSKDESQHHHDDGERTPGE